MDNRELKSKQLNVELFLELCLEVKNLQPEFANAEYLSKQLISEKCDINELFPKVRKSGKKVRELAISVINKADILWDSINNSIISAARMTEEEYFVLKKENPQLANDIKSIPDDMLLAFQGFKEEVIRQAGKEFNANGIITVEQYIKIMELFKAIILDIIPWSSTFNKVFDIITDVDPENVITDGIALEERKKLIVKILTLASLEVGVAMRLAETSKKMLTAVYSKNH